MVVLDADGVMLRLMCGYYANTCEYRYNAFSITEFMQ